MSEFRFKQFTIRQYKNAMKLTTDACILGAYSNFTGKTNLLDIGAGTGVLALMCAQRFPELNIAAVEIDKESYEELSLNVSHSPWNERIRTLHTDIIEFADNQVNWGKFDAIISNPPYFSKSLLSPDSRKNAVRHSNILLDLKQFLKAVSRLMSSEGTCIFIYPYNRIKEVKAASTEYNFGIKTITSIKNTEDSIPNTAIFNLILDGNCSTENNSIIIKQNDKKTYSNQAQKLMSQFYLIL